MLKVGGSHSWSVDVIGEPITDKTWTQGESYLTKAKEALITEEHERITLTHSDYNTIFEIKDALRKDNCKYKVRAENCNGFDEEWVELVVLGRPARPEGPLEVSNITAEGCKLRWKAPLDDGGKPIQVEKISGCKKKISLFVFRNTILKCCVPKQRSGLGKANVPETNSHSSLMLMVLKRDRNIFSGSAQSMKRVNPTLWKETSQSKQRIHLVSIFILSSLLIS